MAVESSKNKQKFGKRGGGRGGGDVETRTV